MIFKHTAILLFVLFSIHLSAQTLISGTVLDRETKRPIEGVLVQNKSRIQNVIFSDREGKFSLQAEAGDSVAFRCLGYMPVVVAGKHVGVMAVVHMEPEARQLDEVTITYEDLNRLLQKSFYNLKKRLICKLQIPYLWYGVETEKNSGEKKEGHALYIANLLKTAPDKEKIPYQLTLVELKHTSPVPLTSTVLTKDLLTVEYHIQDFFDISTIKEFYNVAKVHSDDSSQILIKCTPKNRGKATSGAVIAKFYIQKKDTVFLAFQLQSIDSLLQQRGYKHKLRFKYKRTHDQVLLSYQSYGDFYYLSQLYMSSAYSMLVKGKEEIVEFIETTTALPNMPVLIPPNAKKLNGYSAQLFKLKNTTEEDFWTKYLKENKE